MIQPSPGQGLRSVGDTNLNSAINDGRPLEFRLGASLLRGSQALWLYALVLVLPLLVLAVPFFAASAHKGSAKGIGRLLAALSAHMAKDPLFPWRIGALAVALALVVVFLLLQRRAYLRLSSYGLEAYVPKGVGLGLTGLTTGRWSIPWDSIRSVQLFPGRRTGKPTLTLAGYRLVIESDSGQTRLSPFAWVLRGGPDHRLTLGQALRPRRFHPAELVDKAPLLVALRARGIEVSTEAGEGVQAKARAGYDLFKSPGLVVQLVVFFGAGLYALIDALVLRPYRALEPLPVEPFAVVALAAVVLVTILGRGVPARERAVVGVLTVVALTAAVYPGLLRVNAITAEPREVAYRSVSPGRFEPVAAGLPPIDLRGLKVGEYWAQYPPGAEHKFGLLRGAVGFYELDMAPVYARTRDFYSTTRAR